MKNKKNPKKRIMENRKLKMQALAVILTSEESNVKIDHLLKY